MATGINPKEYFDLLCSNEYESLINKGAKVIFVAKATCCNKLIFVDGTGKSSDLLDKGSLSLRGMHCNKKDEMVYKVCVGCDVVYEDGAKKCPYCDISEYKEHVDENVYEYEVTTETASIACAFFERAHSIESKRKGVVINPCTLKEPGIIKTKIDNNTPMLGIEGVNGLENVKGSIVLPDRIINIINNNKEKTEDEGIDSNDPRLNRMKRKLADRKGIPVDKVDVKKYKEFLEKSNRKAKAVAI